MKATFILSLLQVAASSLAQEPFSFEALRARARAMAMQPYQPPQTADLPRWLAELDFDGYRRIRFREETALWAADDLPFRVHFSHRGYLFPTRVPIHVVDGAKVEQLMFHPDQFHYGFSSPHGEVPPTIGYAGATLLFRDGGAPAEIASFRGASFFRLVGHGQRYGASARGLALDPASSEGEEHPAFVEMWVERPLPGARRLTLHALLDGPSVTGAYRIVLAPGEQTTAEIDACIYARHTAAKIGLGPLSSMFLHGELRDRSVVDFRPERHDSDGLLFADSAGGWSWRPLRNPEGKHVVTAYPLNDPAGFGLLQRDRRFATYEDLEDRYELRPSLWIAPRGNWGEGHVELLEIPSDVGHHDNIACYWVRKQPLERGGELAFAYTLSAFLDDPGRPPLARVRNTMCERRDAAEHFLLDFEGAQLGDDPGALRAEVHTSRGEIRNVVLQRNDIAGGVRCSFEVVVPGGGAVDLRASLWRDRRQVSETWVMPWQHR